MPYNALNPPPLVRDKPANEVMRVAVHNGELHFVAAPRLQRSGRVGRCCSSMRRATSRAPTRTTRCVTEEEALERIRTGFEKAIREPPEGSSETTEIKDAP